MSTVLERARKARRCHCNSCYMELESDLRALLAVVEAADPALEALDMLLSESGGCDHSVGICCCEEIRRSDGLHNALGALTRSEP